MCIGPAAGQQQVIPRPFAGSFKFKLTEGYIPPESPIGTPLEIDRITEPWMAVFQNPKNGDLGGRWDGSWI